MLVTLINLLPIIVAGGLMANVVFKPRRIQLFPQGHEILIWLSSFVSSLTVTRSLHFNACRDFMFPEEVDDFTTVNLGS